MITGFWQVGSAVPTTPLDLILNATTITQIVLAVLAVLSLISWAIMLGAWGQMGKARRAAAAFDREFNELHDLTEATGLAKRTSRGALPRIFLRAVRFIADARNRRPGHDATVADRTPLTASQVETLHLVLEAESSSEHDRLGHYLPWLATIGSASPLIGLFGTVLGIIESFIGIAAGGSGNLSAVAPGVATALTATAAALAVAIPATFGYNIFANRLNRFDGVMENFATAVIALLSREGHI